MTGLILYIRRNPRSTEESRSTKNSAIRDKPIMSTGKDGESYQSTHCSTHFPIWQSHRFGLPFLHLRLSITKRNSVIPRLLVAKMLDSSAESLLPSSSSNLISPFPMDSISVQHRSRSLKIAVTPRRLSTTLGDDDLCPIAFCGDLESHQWGRLIC